MQAVLYAAKSTKDERASIPTQLTDGRALAEAEGGEVVGEYSDEAASAWTGDRGPALTHAMEHAARLAPSWLVVQHTDRLARGDGKQARHLIELYLWAMKAGVTLRSVQDDATCENMIMAAVMGERNAEDSRRKSLAVQAGKKRRAERGQGHGGPRPYGYRYPGHGEPMTPVPVEAAIVRRVFAEFISGALLTEIARRLEADGVPTLRARYWRSTSVSNILENPVYTGKVKHHDELFDGAHEAIIDTDTWGKAAVLLAARPQKGRGRPTTCHHLFRKGMLRCECGEPMVARSQNAGYYQCARRKEFGSAQCDMPHLRRADIDSAVYRYFEQVGLDVDATRRALEESQDRKLGEVRALRTEAVRESQRAAEKLARVRRDYSEGRLEAGDWASFRDELSAEKVAADAAAARLTASEAEIENDSALLDAEREMLGQLTEIRRTIAGEVRSSDGVDAVRAALARLFESFVVRRGAPAGRVHVELVDEALWIDPVVREQAVEGFSESMRPVLRAERVEHRWPVFGGIPVLRK